MKGTKEKPRYKRGFWKPEEDLILKNYVETHGEGNWTAVSEKSGLQRGPKSCRLRWKNYLRPNIKRGMMSDDEKDLILRLHKLLGNRWSLIAGRLPGRTDNEVKNYWNTHLNKKVSKDQINNPGSKSKKTHQLSSSSCNVEDKNLEKTIAVSTKEGEGDAAILSWVKDLENVSNGMDIPSLPAEYLPFFDNDEAFMPILDNLVFLEAFGNSGDELIQEKIFL